MEGYTAGGGDLVFTVTVDAGGVVTLSQQRPLSHPDTTDPDDVLGLDAGLITLTRTDTITDGDGDTAENSASVELGAQLSFNDDAPGTDHHFRPAGDLFTFVRRVPHVVVQHAS